LHCSRKPDDDSTSLQAGTFNQTGPRNDNQIRPPATIRVHGRVQQHRHRHHYSLNQTEGRTFTRLPPRLQSYTNLSQLLDDLQFLFPENQFDVADKLPSIDGGSAAIAMNHISRLRKTAGKVTAVMHTRSDTALQVLANVVVRDTAISPKHLALAANAASASGTKLLWLLHALCSRLAAMLESDPAAFTAQVPPPSPAARCFPPCVDSSLTSVSRPRVLPCARW
jgi:hypothetical protein